MHIHIQFPHIHMLDRILYTVSLLAAFATVIPVCR